MDIDKKIEMLRKRNAMLQEENESLKAQIFQQGDEQESKDKYEKLYKQLEVLKDKWEKEIAEIKELKMKYESMIIDVKKVKDILSGK